jgi:hypothetical protein
VCGYPTSDLPRAEGRRAIRTAFSRNSPKSASLNRDHTLPPPSTTTYTEPSSTRRSSAPYSPTPKPPLDLPSHARHRTDPPPSVRPRNALTQPQYLSPSPSYHRETIPTPTTPSPRTPTRTHESVTRRATSCNDRSNFTRHRVRNRASEWKRLGVSEQVLS